MHDLVFLYDNKQVFSSNGTPDAGPGPEPDTSLTVRAARILSSLLNLPSPTSPVLPPRIATAFATLAEADPATYHTTIKRLYLATALLPLYNLSAPDKKKVVWVGEKVVLEGIKLSTVDRAWELKAREASRLLAEGVRKYANRADEADRAAIGQSNVGLTSKVDLELILIGALQGCCYVIRTCRKCP